MNIQIQNHQNNFSGWYAVFHKELLSYFYSPLSYIVTALFVFLINLFTFYWSYLYETNVANLQSFFFWHSLIYMLVVPALTMRIWAEEINLSTIELLFTFPVKTIYLVLGKFFAIWFFMLFNLVATFPIWITINYLGDVDNLVIAISYLASWMMSGVFIAVGMCASSFTKSSVIAFLLGTVGGIIINFLGFPLITGFFSVWVSNYIMSLLVSFSVFDNFFIITKGLIELRSLLFFTTFIVLFLFINWCIISIKRS